MGNRAHDLVAAILSGDTPPPTTSAEPPMADGAVVHAETIGAGETAPNTRLTGIYRLPRTHERPPIDDGLRYCTACRHILQSGACGAAAPRAGARVVANRGYMPSIQPLRCDGFE